MTPKFTIIDVSSMAYSPYLISDEYTSDQGFYLKFLLETITKTTTARLFTTIKIVLIN